MWAAQFLPFDKPNRWLTSSGLGTMGYGLPAAIGADGAQFALYRRGVKPPSDEYQNDDGSSIQTAC